MKHKLTRITALMLAVIMSFSMLLVPVQAASFTDVPEKAWYRAAVDYVSEKGWMNGVGETTFAPTMDVTRAMFVTLLAAYADETVDNSNAAFTDTGAGKWYTGSAAWAAGLGIVKGIGDGRFAPSRAITRQDLCVMLYKYLQVSGIEFKADADRTYADFASVAAYAKEAVSFCAASGLVTGYEDGSFRPRKTATRAQVAQILMRLDQLRQGQELPEDPMPAQFFEEYPTEDMKVTAGAPQGALPEDSEMVVTRVTDEARLAAMEAQFGRKVLLAADISFRKDATELEPNKEVNVSITCDLLNNLTEFSLVHIADDGSYEYVGNASLMTMYRGSHSKMLRFSAKDFSVYAVLEGQRAVQVNFFNEGATEPHNMQKVIKNGNEVGQVFDPGVDLPDAKVFVGWTIYKNGAPQKVDGKDYYDIAAVNAYLVSNFNSLESIDVKAVLHDVRYLAFVDETDRVLRTVSLTYSNTDPTFTIDQDYYPANSKAQFYGWTRTKTSLVVDYPIGSEITVTADKVDDTYTCRLYPVCKRGNWLVFDNNIDKTVDPTSATFTSPQIVLTGENTVKPADPTRSGYTFGGWYEDAACTREFTFGNLLPDTACDEHGEKKLYAKWEADKTSYLVVYMTQDPENTSEYNYFTSEKRNYLASSSNSNGYVWSTTGANIRPVTDRVLIDVDEQGNVTYRDYNDSQLGDYGTGIGTQLGFYYTYNKTKTEAQTVKARGDGTSILYIYYDRKEVTVNFYKPSSYTYFTCNTSPRSYVSYDFFMKYDDGTYHALSVEETTTSDGWYTYYNYEFVGAIYNFYYDGQNGDWYYIDKTAASPSWKQLNTSYRLYYVKNYTLESTSSGVYESNVPESKIPDLDEGESWFFNDYAINDVTAGHEHAASAVYTPENSITVNLYRGWLETQSQKKNVYYITQDPETGEWLMDDPYHTREAGNIYSPIASSSAGMKFIGYNLARNSRTNGFVSLDGNTSYSFNYSDITGEAAYAYFELRNFELAYHSKTGNAKTESVRYYRNLTPYEFKKDEQGNFTTEKFVPEDGGEGYYFDAWYTDSSYQEKFDFSSEYMPAQSVILEAKWVQERFRVVLDPTGGDPNVHAGVNGTTDPNQVYFPGNQVTTFKIWYGESVLGSSIENVQRPGYELVGWYVDTDPNNDTVFDTPFNFNTPIKDDVVDLSYKDAPAGERQGTDPWNGNLAYNDADGENDNVIGKLVIYAKWRKVLQGDTYVRVVYDCADGTLQGEADWTDPLHYADQAQAVAAPAAQANEAGYMFAKWTVMKNENGQLVETNIDKLPGDTFDVLVENAGEPETVDGHTVYTVYLKASYSTISNTHITWYGNGGVNAENKEIENSPDAIINSFTNIKPSDTFTRDGYVFLGWARLNEDDCSLTKDEAGNITAAAQNNNLDADDLWLIYDEENDSFKVNSTLDSTAPNYPTVSMVAPDENKPYHIMYAVWAPCCYVYHSATGLMEAVPLTSDNLVDGKLDLTQRVTPGYLYGGNYHTMGGLEQDAVNAAKKVAGSSENYVAHVLHAPLYDGSNLYADSARTTKFWTSANAEKNVKGTEMTPTAGAVYYLKEVPSKYLTSRIQYVYEGKRPEKLDEIIDMYLVTIIDDNLYKSAGFKVAGSDNVNSTAFTGFTTLGNSFTIAPRYDGTYTTIDAPFFGLTRGYVGTLHKEDFACKNSVFTMVPTWTTLDGVTVSNNGLTIQIGASGKQDSISWKRNYDGTEKLYVNIKSAKDYSNNTDMNWLADGAVPMVYVYGEVQQWVELKKTSVSGIYQITVPAGKETGLIITRNSPTCYDTQYDAQIANGDPNNDKDIWYPAYGDPSKFHIVWNKTPDIKVPSSAEDTPNYDCTVNYISAFGIGGNASCTWADYLSDQTTP